MSIIESTIEVASKWGKPALYRYGKQSDGSDKLWVVFPGQNYTLDAPLMWYSVSAVLQAHCDVLGIEYGFQSNRLSMQADDLSVVISEAADAISAFMQGKSYRKIGFIAKSLGTIVASELSHIHAVNDFVYLTPLRDTIPFIQRSSSMLVIVGSLDPLFDADDVEKITGISGVHVHVMPGARHSLEIDGDIQSSLGILKRSISLCASFF